MKFSLSQLHYVSLLIEANWLSHTLFLCFPNNVYYSFLMCHWSLSQGSWAHWWIVLVLRIKELFFLCYYSLHAVLLKGFHSLDITEPGNLGMCDLPPVCPLCWVTELCEARDVTFLLRCSNFTVIQTHISP